MRVQSRILSRMVLAATSAALLAGCNLADLHGHPTVERKPLRPARSGGPTAETTGPSVIVSPGIVEPWDDRVDLSAQESGWIARIEVREGEVVRAGQLLASLDDTVQQHGRDLARADLAEAEAMLARLRHGTRLEELRQAQAESDQATARAEFAKASAARTRQLHDEGIVSDVEADRAQADARAQAAEVVRAAARLLELERGPRAEDRAAAAARVVAARARLQVAEDTLSRRHVVAPRAGTVLLSRFHAGEFYNAGAEALLVLGDVSRLQVRLEVDEIDALDIAPASACTLFSDAGVRLGEGKVVRLAPKMGRRSLPLESPTARADIRVREVFVEVSVVSNLLPNQRVWGHVRAASGRNPA